MLKEMPKKYWRNMPETSLVKPLIAGARQREIDMIDASIAKEGLRHALEDERRIEPGGNIRSSWEALMKARASASAATSTSRRARRSSAKARSRLPSCSSASSPATRRTSPGVRSWALQERFSTPRLRKSEIDRSRVYVTNAVKHFKFVQKGKKRIHSKPGAGEIEACRWWISQERALIRPPVTVALGASAARSLIGKSVTIGQVRGKPLSLEDGSECWVTVHPSSLLRMPDAEARNEARALFERDLKLIKKRAEELAS